MTNIQFEHRIHPRAKRLIMRVEPDGKLVVTTPRFTPQKLILKFINEHKSWIVSEKARQETKPKPVSINKVMLFGSEYEKVLEYSSNFPVGVRISGKKLILNSTDSKQDWSSSDAKLLKNYLKHTAEKYIRPRTMQISQNMDIKYNNVTLREQKTRWGSCSTKGNLNFNWRLVHYSTEIIDYVIIHELAHRQYMDHSKNFWSLVETFDPEYRKHRGFLKRQGMSLG